MSVEITRLPSGLSVVTDRMPHLESATLGVWVGAGSRYEMPDEHGISHLLEHMAFKGTTRRTSRQIAEEIEAVGGDLNAATSTESTAYFARVLKADVPLALDVLSDILTESTFDAEELRREQNVIVQEIGAAEDAPDDLVFERLHETAFPKQSLGRSILGTRGNRALVQSGAHPRLFVAQLSRARHAGGRRRRHRAQGDRRRSREAVCELHRAGRAVRRSRRSSAAARGSRPAISSRCISRWRCKACRPATSSSTACRCSSSVLGGGMSSRLFQEVREKRGLCYTINAFHMPYSDTGLFGLYAGTDEADAPELMRVAIDQIAIATETLNETEVARAKAQMKASLLMALESSEARLGQIARQMLAYGRPIPLDEIVAKVDAVTVESARAAGRALIGRGKPAIAALGPGNGLESTAAIAESLVSRAAA